MDAGRLVVQQKIAEATGLAFDAINITLAAAAKVKGLLEATAEAFIIWAQKEAKADLSDIAWNQHWDGIGKMLAIILSGNKIDWLSLMLGLLQIALDIFKKR